MKTISHELITVDDILGWNPCPRYTRKRLERLVGDGVTLMEILRSHIETKNKIWIATRPGVLSSRTRERWLEIMCERAIRRVLGKSGIPTWEIWAEQWISGTDRSAGAASNAARAAYNAARAAYNAAYNAARSAASAADTAYATYATYGTYEVAYNAASNAARSAAYNAAYNAARDAEQRQQVRDLLFIIKGEIK